MSISLTFINIKVKSFILKGNLCAVLTGGLACFSLEYTAEIVKVKYTAVLCDGLYLQGSVEKQMLCVSYALFRHKLGKRLSRFLFEKAREIAGAYVIYFSQIVKT